MLIRRALIAAVLIVAICAFAGLSRKAEAAPNLTVINSYGYRDVLNDYSLFAEVQNSGDMAATNIYINASFYDVSNNLINSSNNIMITLMSKGMLTDTFVLNPGAKVSFWTMLWSAQGGANVDHYAFTVSFDESANNKTVGLQILSCTTLSTGADSWNVTGTVKNVGATAQSGIDIYATFYDSGGKVVGTTWLSWINQNVSAGDQVQFNCSPLILPAYPYVKPVNFAVTAQSPDYATASAYTGSAVPEFPSFLATMLLMAAATAILIFYKKRQI